MEDILKDIERGYLIVVKCEPLAEMTENLRWCPKREECEELYDNAITRIDCAELLEYMHCDFCESEDWIIIAVTQRGTLLTLLATEEFGEKVKKLIST